MFLKSENRVCKTGFVPPRRRGRFSCTGCPGDGGFVAQPGLQNRVCKTGFAQPGLFLESGAWRARAGGVGRPPLLGPGTVPFGSREIGGGARRRGVGCPRFGWGVGGLGRRRRGVTSWRRAPPPTGRQREKILKSTIFDARSHPGEGCQPENALQKRNIAAQLQAIRSLPDQ